MAPMRVTGHLFRCSRWVEYQARFGPGLDEVWILQDDKKTTELGENWLRAVCRTKRKRCFLQTIRKQRSIRGESMKVQEENCAILGLLPGWPGAA
ncbi:hypothetical protein [Klebsiella phage vB_KshKPC-M]|nr:hypothetical protein [Klebsiella phage vB_KshKPC-M]